MFVSLQKMEFKLKTTTSDTLILLQGVTPRGKTGLCECSLSDLTMFLPRSVSADDSSHNITIVNSFMHCPRIELSDTDIDKLEDTEGHIHLVDKGVKFGPGEFFSEHGTTIVCLDTYRKRLGGVANEPILKIDTSQRMPFVYYIFSLVCSTHWAFCYIFGLLFPQRVTNGTWHKQYVSLHYSFLRTTFSSIRIKQNAKQYYLHIYGYMYSLLLAGNFLFHECLLLSYVQCFLSARTSCPHFDQAMEVHHVHIFFACCFNYFDCLYPFVPLRWIIDWLHRGCLFFK